MDWFVPLLIYIHKVIQNILISFRYLSAKIKTSIVKKDEKKNKKRFDFFDVNKLEIIENTGLLTNEEEWRAELPNEKKRETVRVFGVNSFGQSLNLTIKWKPKSSTISEVNVEFCYTDREGNTYSMSEKSLTSNDSTQRQYKGPAISLEVLSPFRRLRIKFRGFLKKNGTNELVFLKMRVLWLAISNVFDYECDHNKQFIEKELNTNKNSKKFEEIKFENRFEQLGQMKGTLQFEEQNEENLFLWGNKSKNYSEPEENRTTRRLFGYSKKGWVFHIGSVEDHNRKVTYRFGFAFWGRSVVFPIDSLSDISLSSVSQTQKSSFSLNVCQKEFEVSIKNLVNQNIFNIEINGFEGRALFSVDNQKEDEIESKENFKNELYFAYNMETNALVLLLNDRKAENVDFSGGKGSSLASLNYFRQKTDNSANIEIPKGIVVTCNAYKLMINHNKNIKNSIDNMRRVVSELDSLKRESLNVVNTLKSSQLPQEIKDQIRSNLKLLFDENEINNKSFAVRSSAAGEDSEEMSAAGQMTTYLGIKGLDAIYSAVVKCWSSQFEFVAIEYKRGYGQNLNSLMAVVIQEMVDCDSAGVLFTCDPVSGNESELIISGNFGIGESVVSAMAEPDTIRVKINIKDNSFEDRTVEGIKSISIGSKTKAIKMAKSGDGTVEVETVDQYKCCLSPYNIKRLAKIALDIQKFFGSVRDIEWGLKDDIIFILQSRPITNLDSGFTEFELMHELDSGLPSEKEYLTKANVGEVLAGCSSTFALNFNYKLWLPIMIKDINKSLGQTINTFCPYALSDLMSLYNHCFLDLKNSEFLKISNENDSDYCKAMILSIFGHELDPEIIDDCKQVTDSEPWTIRYLKNYNMAPFMLFPKYYLDNFYENTYKNKDIFEGKYETTSDLFDSVVNKTFKLIQDVVVHIKISEASGMWNYFLIKILSQNKNNPNIFTDFAFLLSECGQLESADVPSALRELAKSIENPKIFREMSDEKALQYLNDPKNKSNQKFKEFMSRHGHRGYKEFDSLVKVWREDPIPVIKSLKTTLSSDVFVFQEKPKRSISEVISSLKTPLSYTRKQLLKNVFLPLARRGVASREMAKSITIYSFDILRKGCREVGQRMHSEGLIPEADLFFHMTPNEIKEVIQNRNPLIVWKARQRKRLHKKMDNWKFDEIISGFDLKPRELMQNNFRQIEGKESIKGTPVSVGQIVAKVCVAPNLEDAVNIEPGDILVTYSTDIGWSPYFPMIGGIVTEIGGLISHGAVIAREYGLPCLVGAVGACHRLKSGDIVLLDCQKGIITKVDDNNNDNNNNTDNNQQKGK